MLLGAIVWFYTFLPRWWLLPLAVSLYWAIMAIQEHRNNNKYINHGKGRID